MIHLFTKHSNTTTFDQYLKSRQAWWVLSVLCLWGFTTNLALADTQTNNTITNEMIESYLDQAFEHDPNETLVRYEEKALKAGWLTSDTVPPSIQRTYIKQFDDNINLYRKLTGLNIININSNGNKAGFIMVINGGNITDVTTHEMFNRYFYYKYKTKEARQKAIAEDRKANPMNTQNVFIRNPERTINLVISIINSEHQNIDPAKKLSSITRQVNQLFFRAFARPKNLKNLPSISSVDSQFEELQPMDIAYIKSLYDPQLKAGMTYKKAKPILTKLMQQHLSL